MTTVTDLEHRPLPQHTEVNEPRMSGTLAVHFGHSGRLEPLIRFGTHTFGADTNVTINGIDYVVCGALVTRDEHNDWRFRSTHYMRRTGTLDDGTNAAQTAIRTWMTTTARRLAEQHPNAFDTIAPTTYDTYDTDVDRLEEVIGWIRTISDLCNAVAAGTHQTTTNTTDLPTRIRWKSIGNRLDIGHRYTGWQEPGRVVGAVTANGTNVGYIVGTGRHGQAGTTPLLVPTAIVTSETYD